MKCSYLLPTKHDIKNNNCTYYIVVKLFSHGLQKKLIKCIITSLKAKYIQICELLYKGIWNGISYKNIINNPYFYFLNNYYGAQFF